jgi:hypothetical protein
MFSKCRLRLIQTSGKSPNADPNTEKWLIVELKWEFLEEYLTYQHLYEWRGEGFMIWGKYSVKGNNTGNHFDSSFYIGQGEPKKSLKIWRYKPSEMSFYFGTITTDMVGGGLKYEETAIEVRNDLVLNKAMPVGSKIKPVGELEYSNGFVDVPSWIQPFRKGTLFWMPNDIELGR